MKHLNKCRIVGGVIFFLCALVLSWLFNTESSPLYKYFLYHGTLPNFWAALNVVPYGFAIVTARFFMSIGLPESTGGYIGLFLQWFLIGWLVSGLICKKVSAPKKPQLPIWEALHNIIENCALNMKRLNKCRLCGGIVLAIVSLVLEWLIKAESSPLYQYRLYHVGILNTWVAINFMCNIFAILVSPIANALAISDSSGYYIALFVQWFLIGWLVSALICKRVSAQKKPASVDQ